MVITNEYVNQVIEALDRSSDGLTIEVAQDDINDTTAFNYVDEDGQQRGQIVIGYDQAAQILSFEVLNFHIPYQGADIYARMIGFFPDWARSLKLYHLVVPGVLNYGFMPSLIDTGFELQDDGSLSQDITDPTTSRIDQYNDWVAGKASEPDWHVNLPPEYKLTVIDE